MVLAPWLGFPRTSRLRRRAEYIAVQSHSFRHVTSHFIVLIRPGDTDVLRIGITASKRVGNAVVRNRWKRRIREAFRHIRPGVSVVADMVVIAKAQRELPSPMETQRELLSALDRWTKRRRRG